MNTSSLPQTRGFTLLEMTVVLLLMTLLASVAIRETNGLSFQVRYEQTRERLERIREAILGNPRQIINGQQAVSGFVADMGRLPKNLHELLEQHFCSDRTYSTQTTCEAADKLWKTQPSWQPHAASGLWSGWRGPYLNISGSALAEDAFVDGWGNEAAAKTDQNYGWWFFDLFDLTSNELDRGNMIIQSFGKNQEKDNSIPTTVDYEDDYPSNHNLSGTVYYPNPVVHQQDWRANISGGINVNFIKSTEKLPPISLCSDPTKSTKSACELVGGIWHGGCDQAGYYNKDSCTGAPSSGNWFSCSDGTNMPRSTCELAGNIWYGEGFGCSDQSKSNKALCTGTWRSCTDDGTITTENECLSADQIWYGNNIFSINTSSDLRICMKIFYRKSDSSIGVLISDEDITNDATTVNYDSKSIIADGSFQTIRFANLRDSSSNSLVKEIPIGTNAIGIYKHDGTICTDTHYPADRQNPIQVDFHPRAGLPVINW
ncbi:prepilin-type N-terminal cleavage/methylation domain-containing protein [Methylobacter marinus]|uniref:prepilin-type N-terminal cleavage/methylation domain-containing protein n=1 Tax=Methylobacter marinus TaxID=34058 RepID=UPI0003A4BE14|nr:prepilin-type N-terminal cleavage/methylation domain-containing protein [Methylobacter marinus]